jgi:hypothetical protein
MKLKTNKNFTKWPRKTIEIKKKMIKLRKNNNDNLGLKDKIENK